MNRKNLFLIVAMAIVVQLFAPVRPLFASSTDACWQYVSPIPDEWRARRTGDFNATGVITNGNYRLFVKRNSTTGDKLTLASYTGGYESNRAVLDGSGVLDLSKPIYIEGTDTRLYMTSFTMHGLIGASGVTDLIAPPELEALGGYFAMSGCTSLTNVVFDCPNLKTIGAGAFDSVQLRRIYVRSDQLTEVKGNYSDGLCAFGRSTRVLDGIKFISTNPFRFRDQSFWYMPFTNATVDDFSFDKALEFGRESFATGGGSSRPGLTGFARFPIVEKIGRSAFSDQGFSGVEIGYDSLQSIGADAFRACPNLSKIVIGAGPAPVKLSAGVLNRGSWSARRPYRVFFRGSAPDLSGVAAGTWAFDDQSGDKTSRFYIPYGDASWQSVVAAAEPCSQAEFNAAFPDDDAEVVGIIPDGAIGNRGKQYLCYDDYRRFDADLTVDGVPEQYATVSPAYGLHREFAAGDIVPLSAPAEAVDFGNGVRMMASKYVIETIDHRGRWTNAETNDYVAGSSSIELPDSGRSIKVTWIFDRQWRMSLAPLMTADYPAEQVTCSIPLDPDGGCWIAEGGTCTLTARAESPDFPKTRFVRWEGDVGEADPLNPVLTLTADRVRQVRAVFSHGWYRTATDRITDGVWTLKVHDVGTVAGERRIGVGSSSDDWATALLGYSGTLGVLDLSSPVEGADDAHYVITRIRTHALSGSASTTLKNNLRQATLPEEVSDLGSHIFLQDVKLTNVVMRCPRLAKTAPGLLTGCTDLLHAEIVCTNLVEMKWQTDYSPLQQCHKIRELTLNLPALKSIPPYFCSSPLDATDATGWVLSSVTNVGNAAFSMRVSNSFSGPSGILNLPALEGLSGQYNFNCCSRLTGIRLGSGRLRSLGEDGTATAGMKSLKIIELGLARENDIGSYVFGYDRESCPAPTVTNVTFTAAPPASDGLFTAMAATHDVPADGSKTLMYVADFRRPGWSDAYLASMGFDKSATSEEAVQLAKLTPKERRWFRGVVWTKKRHAWLFALPCPQGFVLVFR